ncbi:hypothetical protein GGR21_001479 [Dysgonomonas hofstadii]|uniref:Signal transduction histidine kinase internal region domain-containing protein n=1 Tax=Dysgonomonas hofstadii TaxID=637886 RepID=A0A840CJP1_9BACT|nr:histidine kinase [Dysgonomonas hofstadii]MBB4035586.1 hypothetical protein [Dysgonomonas hofstadii]
MRQNNHNILIELLVSPRYRIVRHLTLFIFVLFVAMNFVGFMEEDGVEISTPLMFIGITFFIIVFMGGNYLNIYILTPRFLLKNKFLQYFLSLFGLVIIIMAIITLIPSLIIEVGNQPSANPDPVKAVVSVVSSTLSFLFFFAGSTSFVLFKHWILDMRRAKELESATMQLELKMLENQINPHFLFNMLNNANIMIKKDPDMALHIINKLEEMLRYQMDESGREKVSLKEEILFLSDFLELEKTRRDRFDYSISVEGNQDNIQIPPLLFITFVENAVKHNLDGYAASYVNISFEITKKSLVFICENSIPQQVTVKETGGIGLANIKRRLNLLYDNNYSLEQTKTDSIYTIKLELKL